MKTFPSQVTEDDIQYIMERIIRHITVKKETKPKTSINVMVQKAKAQVVTPSLQSPSKKNKSTNFEEKSSASATGSEEPKKIAKSPKKSPTRKKSGVSTSFACLKPKSSNDNSEHENTRKSKCLKDKLLKPLKKDEHLHVSLVNTEYFKI